MDKKLLMALDNLSYALEYIAETLSNKPDQFKSDVSKALVEGNLVTQIKSIDDNIKQINKDNKEILKNQNTLLSLSKQKDKNSINLSGDPKTKDGIKTGVTTIIAIAAGVLAIGAAFKLVGDVNFASVMSLAIALPLIAYSFVQISKMGGIKIADMLRMTVLLTMISMSIVATSHILSNVRTVSKTQLATSVAIAGAFALISLGLDKMTAGASKANLKGALMLPIVLVAISAAITYSSYLLSMVKPLSIAQIFTTVLLAGAFTILSFGIEKMTKGLKDVNPLKIAVLPLVFIAISYAIAKSSELLQSVQNIKFSQFLSIVMISAAFVVMSYALAPLSKGLKDVSIAKVTLFPLVLVSMATAVTASSYILQNTQIIDPGKLGNIILQAGTLALVSLALFLPIKLLGKMSVKDIVTGGISIIGIAGVIMVASLILNMGTYDKYPDLAWSAGVGLSLVTFGLSAVALGAVVMSGIGAGALALGAVAILGIAAVIVATGAILATGNYGNFPTLAWSAGVGLSLGAFSLATMALGGLIIGSFGLGALALKTGNNAILSIADNIVKVAAILRTGNYTGGPTKEWAEGIGMALGSFSIVYRMMMANSIMKIFGSGGVGPDDFTQAIITISNGIVTSANVFARASGVWKNGPTKEWAEGVGISIGAFAPVFHNIADKGLIGKLFGSGVSLDDMNNAINVISKGIVHAGLSFADSPNIWKNGPTKEWAEGVAQAINGFVEVYKLGDGFFNVSPDDIEDYNKIIVGDGGTNTVVGAIKAVALSFGNINYKPLPSNMMSDISKNITEYLKLAKSVESTNGLSSLFSNLFRVSNSFDHMAFSVDRLGKAINSLDSKKLAEVRALSGITVMLSTIDPNQYQNIMNTIADRYKMLAGVTNDISYTPPASTQYKNPTVNVKPVVTSRTGAEKDIADLYKLVERVIPLLSSIDASTNNISSVADESRSDTLSLTKKS